MSKDKGKSKGKSKSKDNGKPKNNTNSWSDADVATLKKKAKTSSAGEVARLLQRTPAATQQKAMRMGISFRKDAAS